MHSFTNFYWFFPPQFEWGICFYGHSALLVKPHPVATALSGSPDIFPWGFALTHSRGKVVNPPQLTGVLPAHLILLPRFRVADTTESLTSTRYAGLSATHLHLQLSKVPPGPLLAKHCSPRTLLQVTAFLVTFFSPTGVSALLRHVLWSSSLAETMTFMGTVDPLFYGVQSCQHPPLNTVTSLSE